jgi:hypothetical protein
MNLFDIHALVAGIQTNQWEAPENIPFRKQGELLGQTSQDGNAKTRRTADDTTRGQSIILPLKDTLA